MGIICSDSDAEPAKSMGRLLRCLSFLHRHDQSRGTTNLDAEWPPQPDPDPDPVVYFATPTRSPPGDRNLDDRYERCDHTAQQARTAFRTNMLIGSSASTGPIPAGESCVSQHLRGIAVVTCFSVEQVRGLLPTSGDGPENHQFRREVSIVFSAGDRQAGRPW